jgi:hypothetical protein
MRQMSLTNDSTSIYSFVSYLFIHVRGDSSPMEGHASSRRGAPIRARRQLEEELPHWQFHGGLGGHLFALNIFYDG